MAASESEARAGLAERCRRGETSAFTEVYRLTGRSLYGTALRVLRRAEEAEDAVQETFLSFYRKPPDVPDPQLPAWLHRVLVNHAIDRIRRGRRWQETSVEDHAETASAAAVLIVVLAGSASPPLPPSGPSALAPMRVVQVDSRLLREEGIERRVEREVAARGRGVSITAAASQVRIGPSNDDRVRIKAELEFWSDDEAWMKRVDEEFELEVEESSGTIAIRVELPQRGSQRPEKVNVHYPVELTVDVPVSTALEGGARGSVELEGRYGNLRVTDVEGDLQAKTTSGHVEVRRVSGGARLASQYGNISVENVGGMLDARAVSGGVTAVQIGSDARIGSSYANVEVRDVQGRLEVKTSSGKVTVSDIRGAAIVTTSYGSVDARDVQGDLTIEATSSNARVIQVGGSLRIENSYGDVEVERIKGKAQIRTGSGGFTVTDVERDLAVRNSYGAVRVKRIGGRLNVEAASSDVTAEDVGGSIDVETSDGGVSLRGVGGAVAVRNQSGAVSVRGLSGEALRGQHQIETSYADIDFSWPASQKIDFRLESTYGQIRSGIPGTLRENGSRRTMEGGPGGSPARLTLVAKAGSVRLDTE